MKSISSYKVLPLIILAVIINGVILVTIRIKKTAAEPQFTPSYKVVVKRNILMSRDLNPSSLIASGAWQPNLTNNSKVINSNRFSFNLKP